MKKGFLGVVFLLFEALGGAAKPFHDSFVAFRLENLSITPACEDSGRKLCLHFFKNNIPVAEYSVTLKEGHFLEQSIVLINQTPYCRKAEEEKNKAVLAQRIAQCPFWDIASKGKQKRLFKEELAREQSLLEQRLGAGARMVRVYGEPISLEATGHLIFLWCQAIVGGVQVTFEVDVAHFCDVDAWAKIQSGEPTWQWERGEEYEENYFSDMRMIGF